MLLFLVMQCWILLARSDANQCISTDSMLLVATINFKGSRLNVFDIHDFQLVEPRISFGDTCDSIRYNYLYQKFQLALPINIDINVLNSPTENSKRVGHVTLSDLKVNADEGVLSKDSKLTVIARLKKSEQGELIFLCETFMRCQQLKDEISAFPVEIQDALRLEVFSRIGGYNVKFGAVTSANAPRFDCAPGQWVVFQRRVDGNLSFAQNWDSYVKGFGNPNSNYWMGLDKLSAMTVTSVKSGFPDTARCQLRIETQDLNGHTYWGQYHLFQVLGAEQNYRLRIGQEVAGSQMDKFVTEHNEMAFSTHDSDNDKKASQSCSQEYGFGGWWYNKCHAVNLNGAYTTDKSLVNDPAYNTIDTSGRSIPMRNTLMKFKCN